MQKGYVIFILLFPLLFSLKPEEDNRDLSDLQIYDFQYKMFLNLILSKDSKNIIISPLSIYQTLSLLGNGSTGKTQTEIVNALNAKTIYDLNRENSLIIEELDLLKDRQLSISSVILTKVPAKNTFIQFSLSKYYIDVLPYTSAEDVNKWFAEKTQGKISKIIETISYSLMLSLNAVYFKGEWEFPFDKFSTYPEQFNKDQKANMMKTIIPKAQFYEDQKVQIVELPYKNSDYTAIIILPSEKIDINIFLSNFSNDVFKEYMSLLKETNVQISLPKFSVTYEMVLNNILQDMGIVSAFEEENANFSSITEDLKLVLSRYKCKTFLRIDEKGTTADSKNSKPVDWFTSEEVVKMKVNRSFFFGIRKKEISDLFVFMAKIQEVID